MDLKSIKYILLPYGVESKRFIIYDRKTNMLWAFGGMQFYSLLDDISYPIEYVLSKRLKGRQTTNYEI